MIAPTVLTRRTIATQIHLLAKTRRSTGRRYRSTRAITSSVIWTTANTPRATRPHTGTEDNNESITYALSPSCLAHHANADGPSGRQGCIGHFVPAPEPWPLAAPKSPGSAGAERFRHTDSVIPSAETANAPAPRRAPEVLAVLGVSLGLSGVYALLSYLRAELTVKGGISATTATVASGAQTSHMGLDIAYDVTGLVQGLMPVLLVLVLLSRDPAIAGFGIGLHRRPARRELLQGAGFAALVGIPGLILVWAAHNLGVSANLAVVDVPDTWYRVPLLLLQAAQNGALEEIVVVGYLLTRLRQMGWSNGRALGASAVLRGSYHLYQGLGGFVGNLVMGLIFAWWFQRTRCVLPLVVAHFLLDVFAFVGFLYLRQHISWI